MMLVSIVLGMASSAVFDIHPLHGLFVAACLALSSTPLVSRFLESKHLHHVSVYMYTHIHLYVYTVQCIYCNYVHQGLLNYKPTHIKVML